MLRGQEPCGYAAGTGKSPFQFTLAQLMGAVTLWAVALSIGKTIGFSIVVPKLLQLALFALLITFPVLVVAAMRRASWLFWDVVRHRDKGDED
jgi:membrane protein DedA with SNARE-associated domain